MISEKSTLSCAITGHRPARFKFGYNEHYKLCVKIKKALAAEIKACYEKGGRRFWVGGAIGVDTWAAEILLELKQQERYKDIELYIAIPFPDYDAKFDAKQKARCRDILKGCTGSVVVSPVYSPDAYKKRNYYMVDHAECLIAVYDNNKEIRSGTGMTAHYAQKKGLPMRFIHPDTAEVN
jgi:uncharacterized phage-like protein YoqJ